MSVTEPAINASREGVQDPRLESYRRLADVFHDILSEISFDSLLDRIADALGELIPYDTLTIYEARNAEKLLIPVFARDPEAERILESSVQIGEGLTGWSVEHRQPILANDAHLDPRVMVVPGTPLEPEALITVPLIARGSVKGALNIYRLGEQARFTDEEFELAIRFGDAAALAIDNAQTRARLERDAQTDSVTGLYNHRFFQDRLRAELTRVSRFKDSVSLLMIDLDDFKKINDVYGHGCGDQILMDIAELLKTTIRASDVACRIGGEEFAVIMPSCDAGDALVLANRIAQNVSSREFEQVGRVTVSIGVAQGPEHATNPRELLGCADAAMLTAKARGKDRIVLFGEGEADLPKTSGQSGGDVRSIAHLKMLQSVVGKLNRQHDVREIGMTIANELRTLIDYHSCLVYLREGDEMTPVAARGELARVLEVDPSRLVRRVGEGIVGHVAATAKPLLIANALDNEHAIQVPGTPEVEESIASVPLTYGSTLIGAILMSKLGTAQFDDDDVRLLQVLSGHASVALENARLYEAQRKEANNAKALLEFADAMAHSASVYEIGQRTVAMAGRILEANQSSLWLFNPRLKQFRCVAHHGYVGDTTAEPVIRAAVSEEAGRRFLAERKEPFTVTAEETDEYFQAPEGVESRTLAIAPLHGIEGWITVRQPAGVDDYFDPDRLRLLSGLSYQTSIAMQKAMLYRDQKETAEIANALLEFGRELGTAEELPDVLSRTAHRAALIMGSPKTSVWLQTGPNGELEPHEWWGYEGADAALISNVKVPAQLTNTLLNVDRPFIIGPTDIKRLGVPDSPDAELTYAVAPLKLEEGRLGCIAAAAPAFGEYEFSERKMRLLAGIAYQAKLAIANASNFENLEKTFLSTVEALANALEAKDEYTSSHARWITDMALEVGKKLDLDVRTIKRLELGALFHDIGKIGIPSDILLKPGPLDDDEWAIIKLHPELGEKILAPIDRLAEVRPIVRHCHEHFDGSGYPDKKMGEEIPIESRIILVVDAFHAMTSDRSYRKAMSVEEASSRLERSAGTQFDPNVVLAFLDLIAEKPELVEGEH